MKPGTEYEILTQKIFQTIQKQNMVTNIEVVHDQTMKGIMTTHQIDVFWKFKDKNGIIRTVIVECKDWNHPVDQQRLLAFKSILDDLKCQPVIGIFVTRTGYQQGAIKVAEFSGIKLYEIREPLEKDWIGKTKTLKTISTIEIPEINGINFVIDEDWLSNEKRRLNIPKEEIIPLDTNDIGNLIFTADKHHLKVNYPNTFMPKFVQYIELYDKNLDRICSLENIISTLTSKSYVSLHEEIKEITPKIYSHDFKDTTFLKTNHSNIKKVKITAVLAKITIKRMTEKSEIDIEKSIEYILNDVIEGHFKMFSKDDLE